MRLFYNGRPYGLLDVIMHKDGTQGVLLLPEDSVEIIEVDAQSPLLIPDPADLDNWAANQQH
jgi:hypothetical protein